MAELGDDEGSEARGGEEVGELEELGSVGVSMR